MVYFKLLSSKQGLTNLTAPPIQAKEARAWKQQV